jgi:hypothetical protein
MICPVEPLKRQYNLALRNFQTVAIYRGGFFIYKSPGSQVQSNEKWYHTQIVKKCRGEKN